MSEQQIQFQKYQDLSSSNLTKYKDQEELVFKNNDKKVDQGKKKVSQKNKILCLILSFVVSYITFVCIPIFIVIGLIKNLFNNFNSNQIHPQSQNGIQKNEIHNSNQDKKSQDTQMNNEGDKNEEQKTHENLDSKKQNESNNTENKKPENIKKPKVSKDSKMMYLWTLICCCSVIYCFLSLIVLTTENEIIKLFQADGIFFYLTSILVFTYLKTNYIVKDFDEIDSDSIIKEQGKIDKQKNNINNNKQENVVAQKKDITNNNSEKTNPQKNDFNCDNQENSVPQNNDIQSNNQENAVQQNSDINNSKEENANTQQIDPNNNFQENAVAQQNNNNSNNQLNAVSQNSNNNIGNQGDIMNQSGNDINYFVKYVLGETKKNILNYDSFSTFQYSNNQIKDIQAYFLDFFNPISNQTNNNKKQAIQFSKKNEYFSHFIEEKIKINKPERKIEQFFDEFHKYIEPNFKSLFVLYLIISVKIGFSFYYIFWQTSNLSIKQYFDILVFIFLYVYNTFNINRILGNNDLRRKYAFMKNQESFIDFSETDNINLKQKLDITCPISLETWDNARKSILEYQYDWLQMLEWSYVCLFLYFLLVTLVSLSSYFELHWIFSDDSVLQNPIMVIMASFNFIFLSVLFLIRFYYGSKFNNTFEDLEIKLTQLIDVMDDLQTMFDIHFNHNSTHHIADENSLHAIVMKKLKLKSLQYISEKICFENIQYQDKEKNVLRKKLLKNAKQSLEKVKRSLNHDSNVFKYKFLNLIELNFKETLCTLLVALLTILPTVIPKFFKFYQIDTS